MSEANRRAAAEQFVRQWAGTKPSEKGNTHKFWLSLLRDVVGMQDVTTEVQFEVKTNKGGWIDVLVPGSKVLIEQKSAGLLDRIGVRQGNEVTPFEQAKGYADTMPGVRRPDTIIVCDFEEFRLHDLARSDSPEEPYASFRLEELPEQVHLLDFFIKPQQERRLREERITMDAGRLVGELYERLSAAYPDASSAAVQHELNVLCVRLVFLLFAEDAGLLSKDFLAEYLADTPVRMVRTALVDLFDVLDIEQEHRDPNMDPMLYAVPYVNGGLFRGSVEVPQFDEELKAMLIATSRGTDWSAISPTIFGGIFESTLNPSVRRENGMHYTSPKNIHRVIDPLFLDDLKRELEPMLVEWPDRGAWLRALSEYRTKLTEMHFFDPACGSGNFLTETYRELCRLEAAALRPLVKEGQSLPQTGRTRVSLSQFHGIEVNDFAKSVAETSLWIAQIQANKELREMGASARDLPLVESADIRLGNALELDWASVLDPSECSYVIGNPPFIGYSNLNAEQKAERQVIWGKIGGTLDYVTCWFKKAADYVMGRQARVAFVSTNSICQGQQVAPLWGSLFEQGISIDFAWPTFAWDSDSAGKAAVHVVIVGFSDDVLNRNPRLLSVGSDGEAVVSGVVQINGYLVVGPKIAITARRTPIGAAPQMLAGGKPSDGGNLILGGPMILATPPPPPMVRGNQPTDGGWLLMTRSEVDELLEQHPEMDRWIRKFSMGAEFIDGTERYCLWFEGITPQELVSLPAPVRERVEKVREMRLASTKEATRKKAATPWLFDEIRYSGEGTYLAIPKVSSERRSYIPIGFVTDGMIPGDKLFFVPDATVYDFGVITSRMHNAWMRAVAGRLESRYSYSNTIVYNNFVWPTTDAQQRDVIETAAQRVLDEREKLTGMPLKQMYDPSNEWMFTGLFAAHAELDAAVERAYGLQPGLDESELVAHLFVLYEQATA